MSWALLAICFGNTFLVSSCMGIQLYDKTGIIGGYYVSVNAAKKALGKEDQAKTLLRQKYYFMQRWLRFIGKMRMFIRVP